MLADHEHVGLCNLHRFPQAPLVVDRSGGKYPLTHSRLMLGGMTLNETMRQLVIPMGRSAV